MRRIQVSDTNLNLCVLRQLSSHGLKTQVAVKLEVNVAKRVFNRGEVEEIGYCNNDPTDRTCSF